MKKLLLSLAISGLLLTSCEQDLPKENFNEPQEVTFNIGSNGGLLKAANTEIPSMADCSIEADYVWMLLNFDDGTNNGETQEFTIPVFFVNGVLYTQAIKLPPGDYSLEDFILYADNDTPDDDSDDVVVSAAPHAESVYGELVINALDVEFTIEEFTKLEVEVDVYCYQPKDHELFGFVWFKPNLHIVKEVIFFGDFCAQNPDFYEGSKYGNFPKVDMPAIFQIEVYKDSDSGDGFTYDLIATYDNFVNYVNNESSASVPPLKVPYIDSEGDDNYKLKIYIWEFISKDANDLATYGWVYFETWYFSENADIMTVDDGVNDTYTIGPGQDGIYDFIVGPCIVSEWDIDLDDPNWPGDEDDHETAFAYSPEDGVSSCFLDDPLNYNRWGWTNEIDNTDGTTSFDLYAGAAKCDVDKKGEKVGTVTVEISGNVALITFTILSGFDLLETHVYLGDDLLPSIDEDGINFTIAPGQYPHIHDGSGITSTSSDTYSIDVSGMGSSINFVAHASVK